MRYLIRTLLPLVLWPIAAQADASPLFNDNAVIELELSGPIGSLTGNKRDRNEQSFVLSANGVAHDVHLRVRGKSRQRVCDFPPLRIDFSGHDTEQSIFAGQDKLKLVTHCRKRAAAQVNILQEYAAYRIFNLISDVGYRVRLVRITYRDTDERRRHDELQRFGFVIESKAEIADRIGGQVADVSGVSLRSLDNDQAAAVYVFQYMIGNTDWSLVKADEDEFCCHNGDLFDIASKLFYVPYDFDLAGLVDADYAYPDPVLPIRKVTQRMYRGHCTSRDSLKNALDIIRARQAEILSLLHDLPGLPQDDQAKSVEFLRQFFARADDEEKLLHSFEQRCL